MQTFISTVLLFIFDSVLCSTEYSYF